MRAVQSRKAFVDITPIGRAEEAMRRGSNDQLESRIMLRRGFVSLPSLCGYGMWRSRSGRVDSKFRQMARCRSSVVEHSLGKGEVGSSILPGSTSFIMQFKSIFWPQIRGQVTDDELCAVIRPLVFSKRFGWRKIDARPMD